VEGAVKEEARVGGGQGKREAPGLARMNGGKAFVGGKEPKQLTPQPDLLPPGSLDKFPELLQGLSFGVTKSEKATTEEVLAC
jgi:hypothetical protein